MNGYTVVNTEGTGSLAYSNVRVSFATESSTRVFYRDDEYSIAL